jgi:RNA polymerase subunit RPABC4/transcription elongation factor Spt4
MPLEEEGGLYAMNDNDGKSMGKRLTDEELAELLDENLDPVEREKLVSRLENDPESARILALAASGVMSEEEGFSQSTIARLMKTVEESREELNICPHCAGDLVEDGMYCPHCGAQVGGNPLVCHKCGKPVREGGFYCPHCGSFFRPTGGKGVIYTSVFFLVLGLASIALSAVFRNFSVQFIVIGTVSLVVWLGTLYMRWRYEGRMVTRSEMEAEEKPSEKRKRTG